MIFRKESHGGMVFHTTDATFVDLDEDGYRAACKLLLENKSAETEDEKRLYKQLMDTLPSIAEDKHKYDFEAEIVLPGELHSPSLVDFQITERCSGGCPHCYVGASKSGREVTLEDARTAIKKIGEASL
jgi:hypothetical protein